MADKVTTYTPFPDDVVLGFPSGRGVPTFPPNYDRGTDLGTALGHGEELSWETDIRSDPTVTKDPTRGYDFPGTRISEA